MDTRPVLNILFPVYNEENRLHRGITLTWEFLTQNTDIPFRLTIVDNASTDGTEQIARALCEAYPQVSYLRILEKGVGAAFRAGIGHNTADFVGYMDVDLSTDIRHLQEVYDIFCQDPQVRIVNGSRWAKQSTLSGRKPYRMVTSYGLVLLLKLVFGMKASDAICGFKFFRKDTVEALLPSCAQENGWFYIIELLLRAEKQGISIRELPVHWEDDVPNSTVRTVKLIKNYLYHIGKLKKTFLKERWM